ncbi:MAG: M50 family metallopeptidase [Acidimicrobiales bacterium]
MPFDPSSSAMDVILGIAALFTLFTLTRSWRTFWDEDFTGTDRKLAIQVAVFLIPPVVVLFHELGHLVTALALDVRVTGFRYGLFEGSVSVAGLRTREDMWLIAIAGNLVSAGIGLAMVVLALTTRWRRSVRYLLLSGGLLELVFSLVLYPVLSLTAGFGDWEIIYSGRTRGLGWGTAIVHAASLVGLWLWWRKRGRQAMFLIGSGTEDAVAQLRKAVESAPAEPAGWLALADFYARRGELALARAAVEEGLDKCGESPRLLLGLTRLSMFQGRWNDAVMAARRGLEGLRPAREDVSQPLWANLALALTQMERPDHALPAFEHLTPPIVDDVRVRYGRGLMRMEAGDAGGRADLAVVVSRLPEGDLLRSWAEARLAGHSLKDWADARVPAYERGSAPPPPPLAGV